MGSILSVGMSQSSMNSNKSARTSFEKFLVDQNDCDSDWPTTMAELSEEQANDTKMYERFAFWLTYSTDSQRGESYVLGTNKVYVRMAAQQMKQLHNKPGSNLGALDSMNNWLSKLCRIWRGWPFSVRSTKEVRFVAGHHRSTFITCMPLTHP